MSFLHVTGRLGSDAERRTLQDSTPVLSFSVADEIRSKGDKKVQWIKCALFGKRADALAQYLTKGTLVHVVGNPSVNTYEGKGGMKAELQVRVTEIDLHGGGKPSSQAGGDKRGEWNEQEGDSIPF